MCGDLCGDVCGDLWERMPGKQKPCQINWQGQVDGCSGNAIAWLYQTQLFCPFDGRPAIIDAEFTVDALGMCADSAQGDHEFTGDLRPGKLSFEHSKNLKLTLA